MVFFNSTADFDGELQIDDETAAALEEAREEIAAELGTEPETDAAAAESPAEVAVTETETEPDADADAETDDENGDQCDNIEIGDTETAHFIEQRAKRICRRLTAEGGAKNFVSSLVDNLPGMMFFFLPAIALVMVLLYPLSRRYYVEHLLFFVHFHSFFFVLLTITVLFSRMPQFLPGQGAAAQLLSAATTFYVPVYLFVAMRRVYGQSRALTALKYVTLGVAYFVSLLVTIMIVVLFTALSV